MSQKLCRRFSRLAHALTLEGITSGPPLRAAIQAISSSKASIVRGIRFIPILEPGRTDAVNRVIFFLPLRRSKQLYLCGLRSCPAEMVFSAGHMEH